MSTPSDSSPNMPDAILAGSLVAAPAWAPWLTDLNQILTTATLLAGLILGLLRLWQLLFSNRKEPPHADY